MKRMLKLAVATALICGCMACEQQEKWEYSTICGIVTDKDTNEPINGSRVELFGIYNGEWTPYRYCSTGRGNQYEFDHIRVRNTDTYRIHVIATGYVDCTSEDIIVKSGQTTRFDARLEKQPDTLSNIVAD